MISKRLAYEGEQGKDLNQEISRHIWMDVELKLHQAGVKTNISKIVRDLVSSYQGQCLGYDEGLYYGDALLAASLWRNLYGTQPVSPADIKEIVEYIRIQLQRLEKTSTDDVMAGHFKFQ
jgi:cytochrome b pre-mRNA-processing protein 3